MIRKFIGPLLLLAAIVIGDQIRINRPDHKYRLTVEVETPQGVKSASAIMSVHPDRGYTKGGATQTKGDAIFVDLGGGRNLVSLMAHLDEKIDLTEINYVAVRAFNAAGQRAVFKQMERLTGTVPVTSKVIPILATFADASDPSTMRVVAPENSEAALGPGFRLKGLSVAIVPNGFWPLDVGGFLGEPITRSIASKLLWLGRPGAPAKALQAAGLKLPPDTDPRAFFTRD